MSHDRQLLGQIKSQIPRFARELTQGWGKVKARFAREMLYGIQAAGGFVRENEQIQRALEVVTTATERRGIVTIDRGGDRRMIFKWLIDSPSRSTYACAPTWPCATYTCWCVR